MVVLWVGMLCMWTYRWVLTFQRNIASVSPAEVRIMRKWMVCVGLREGLNQAQDKDCWLCTKESI